MNTLKVDRERLTILRVSEERARAHVMKAQEKLNHSILRREGVQDEINQLRSFGATSENLQEMTRKLAKCQAEVDVEKGIVATARDEHRAAATLFAACNQYLTERSNVR